MSRIRVIQRGIVLLIIFFGFLYSPMTLNTSGEVRSEVILVTGFEPFGKSPINSSWEAVRQLNGLWVGKARVIAVELPVAWEQAGVQLRAAIDQYDPDLVVNVGQAGKSIELISSAHNVAGNITDNLGARPKNPLISMDGPSVYETILNLSEISRALEQANIPAVISASAGTYLCNFVSYHSYQYLAQIDPDTATLFVHVPSISSLDTVKDRQTLSQLVDALKIILNTASDQIAFII